MKYLFVLITGFLNVLTARADCWFEAEKMFNIESELLYAIAQQESSLTPSAIGHNRNASKDFGLMQINSIHMKRLNQIGVTEKQLLNDPCVSVIVGASILSDMMKIYGYSWEAIGAYNAGTSPKRKKNRIIYAEKIAKNYKKLKEMPEDKRKEKLSTPLKK